MFADLKEKAAGVDRKRIYTAAAALLIAGAAGHFMQRTAGGSGGGTAMMTASVPPVPSVATETLSAPSEAVASAQGETAPPQGTETGPALAENAPLADTPTPAATDNADQTLAEAPMPAVPPVADTADPAVIAATETPTPATLSDPASEALAMGLAAGETTEPALPDVTRGVSEPILGVTDPSAAADMAIAPADEAATVIAGLSEPVDMQPPAAIAPAEPEMAACAIDVRADALPGALLSVQVVAPCNSGETVSFEHAGLKFAERLGPDGTLLLQMPAMMADAEVALRFDDGERAQINVSVPDFAEFDRMALVWQGATGLQLHALEGGASYGEAGHIWADTPASSDAAILGQGGFISVLGSTSDGYAADVYTYPAALMNQGEEPEVSIEAQVMENTCGHEIEGWILRTVPGRAPNVEPLTMAVPGCDAVGEYLVLKDLPETLTLARK